MCSDHFFVCSFTFANDMFVPVEDAHPLESLLVLDTQVCTIRGSALHHSAYFCRFIHFCLRAFVAADTIFNRSKECCITPNFATDCCARNRRGIKRAV